MEIITDVARACDVLRQGRVVGFPTGTSYGLAVDALQGYALQRLKNLKGRPLEKTFTVFMAEKIQPQFLTLSKTEQRLLKYFEGQPLTLLVTPQAPLTHLAQDGRIGLRLVDHPLMAALAEAAALPLTATSANKTGQPACFTPACVLEKFPGKLDETTYDLSLGCVMDGGQLPTGVASTIAQVTREEVVIIRDGKVTRDELQTALRTVL